MGYDYTRRTMQFLRKEGYTVDVCEKWKVRSTGEGGFPTPALLICKVDLFGIFDLICIKDGREGVLGVQSTSKGALSKHRRAIAESEFSQPWLRCGNRILLIGWYKDGRFWKPKLEPIHLEHIEFH